MEELFQIIFESQGAVEPVYQFLSVRQTQLNESALLTFPAIASYTPSPNQPPKPTSLRRRSTVSEIARNRLQTKKRIGVKTEMNYSGMRLTDYTIPKISDLIMKNKKVLYVNLDNNKITGIGFGQLIKRLANHPTLEELSIQSNYLDETVFDQLSEYCNSFGRLKYFNLKQSSQIKNMDKALRYVHRLRKIGLIVEI